MPEKLFRNKFRIDEGISESIFSICSISQTARRRTGIQHSLRSRFVFTGVKRPSAFPPIEHEPSSGRRHSRLPQLATLCLERSKDAPLSVIISTLFRGEQISDIFAPHCI